MPKLVPSLTRIPVRPSASSAFTVEPSLIVTVLLLSMVTGVLPVTFRVESLVTVTFPAVEVPTGVVRSALIVVSAIAALAMLAVSTVVKRARVLKVWIIGRVPASAPRLLVGGRESFRFREDRPPTASDRRAQVLIVVGEFRPAGHRE